MPLQWVAPSWHQEHVWGSVKDIYAERGHPHTLCDRCVHLTQQISNVFVFSIKEQDWKPFTYVFTQQMCIEHLLCARSWGHRHEQDKELLPCWG